MADGNEEEVETLECDHCETHTPIDDLADAISERGRDIRICLNCAGGNIFPSQSCHSGAWVHRWRLAIMEDSGNIFDRGEASDHCYYHGGTDQWYEDDSNMPADEPDEDEILHDYSTRVDAIHPTSSAPEWLKDRDGALVFGVECEMESKGDRQSALVDCLGGRDGNGRYILKSDGSLNCGVELVTMPYTLQEHRDLFKWQEVMSGVEKFGHAGDTDTCGIHVHINRTAITPLTLGKMLVFVNSPETTRLIGIIAQRSNNSYCQRIKKKVSDALQEPDSRYQAVNVTRRTVEIRIFKGNIRPERILKNIEFCHALCMYLPDCALSHLESQGYFVDWLRKNRKQYPELTKFLIEKGVM